MLILIRCIQGWDANVFCYKKNKIEKKILSKIVQNHKIYW